MICTETGVLPNSHYFFFTPSTIFEKYYYYLLVCGHFHCQYGYKIKRKGNTEPLLICILDGQLHLDYENKQYTGRKGDILLIDCHKPHTYYSDPSCNFLFLHFGGSDSVRITNHLISQNGGALFQLETNQAISQILYELITKLYYEQTINDIELSCIVYNCLCLTQAINEILATPSSPNSSIISNSIYYIRNNISKSLTLKDLADQASLSIYYFSHLFKKETGISPIEYIALTKINIAKTMLKTTQSSVSEIAESLGYSSSSSFINAFTSRVEISPMKFRNMPK
ncbi:MAG: AraC family transcriptional regulator [Firmicutes bacterium HGW-Firmicutes-7]|nr:MAG: AraC family transcriptional regulator [Firmicutes bacterium HGW-Firmicutes-7]